MASRWKRGDTARRYTGRDSVWASIINRNNAQVDGPDNAMRQGRLTARGEAVCCSDDLKERTLFMTKLLLAMGMAALADRVLEGIARLEDCRQERRHKHKQH